MLDIKKIRNTKQAIVALGSHPTILQSMMDFDFLSGKQQPDLKAIISTGKKFVRFFWGDAEILIPTYPSLKDMQLSIQKQITLFINVTSGRRTYSSTIEAIDTLPNLVGGTIFAENVPEKSSIEVYHYAKKKDKFIIGPASVGLLIPNHLKIGAIGGTQAKQLVESRLFESGNVAVFSSSGGMTNELITLVSRFGKHLSFSLSFGGDRFPVCTPVEAFLSAEKDPDTKYIVYIGELGGYDEYDLADLLKQKKIKKQVIAYIAGSISEMFETPPQFGHAKAMASRGEETAIAKTTVLREAGAQVTNSFTEFMKLVEKIPAVKNSNNLSLDSKVELMDNRQQALFINALSTDKEDKVEILGQDLLTLAKNKSFGYIVGSMLLGRSVKSKEFAETTDFIMKLLVDHGPYVSGAVNTMISARAGKDLVSSLVSGLLTIGPRFGGAINMAAQHWFEGVEEGIEPFEYVERIVFQKKVISGIGHKKYRVDFPDPRVKAILSYGETLSKKPYTNFALGVQKVTTAKKGNLILNVDGAIAAILLDMLSQKEQLSPTEMRELIEAEFFNAFFVLSRSVGFTAHYLDQRRKDEGLFRLSSKEVSYATIPKSSK